MMLLALIYGLITLMMCNVSLSESEYGVQKELTAQDVESKIAKLDFFLLVVCEDLKDEDCEETVEETEILLRESYATFAGLEAAVVNDPGLIKKYGVEVFPSLIFFRKSDPIFYTDTETDTSSVYLWMEHHRISHITTLNDGNFEHDTQATTGSTTGDWFIMFYENHCSHLLGIWETVAGWLQQSKVVAKIELSANPLVKKRFGFEKCLTIALLKNGKMYVYKGDPTKPEELATFARSEYTKVDGQVIPPEPVSSFEFEGLLQKDSLVFKMTVIGGVLLVVIIIIAVIASKRRKQAKKTE